MTFHQSGCHQRIREQTVKPDHLVPTLSPRLSVPPEFVFELLGSSKTNCRPTNKSDRRCCTSLNKDWRRCGVDVSHLLSHDPPQWPVTTTRPPRSFSLLSQDPGAPGDLGADLQPSSSLCCPALQRWSAARQPQIRRAAQISPWWSYYTLGKQWPLAGRISSMKSFPFCPVCLQVIRS